MDWDQLFMNMVYLVAMKSKDQSTNIGAIIVGPGNEVVSVGYNSFVRGCDDNVPERQERPEKYFWFEHAERNAIYNSARIGAIPLGCKMYTQALPCMDCARGVVQAGIKELILDTTFSEVLFGKNFVWDDHQEQAAQLFKETGVEVRYITIEPINIHGFCQGKLINLKGVIQ